MAEQQQKLPTPEYDKMLINLQTVVTTGRAGILLLSRIAADGKMPAEFATEAGQVVGRYIGAAMEADIQAAKAKAEYAANELAQNTLGKMTAPGSGTPQ
jgi:hypothetical protein